MNWKNLCAAMNVRRGQWLSVPCYVLLPYFCEIPMKGDEGTCERLPVGTTTGTSTTTTTTTTTETTTTTATTTTTTLATTKKPAPPAQCGQCPSDDEPIRICGPNLGCCICRLCPNYPGCPETGSATEPPRQGMSPLERKN